MTETNAPAATASPVDTAPPATTTTTPPATTTTEPPAGNEPPAFSVPDAYKDKPWAAKVKSQDDLYKQLDNLDTLVGKKTVGTIDYETATPEEIAAHHAKLAPQDKSAYKFSEKADPEFSASVSDVLLKAGINAHQGNMIISEVIKITEGIKAKQDSIDRSEAGYMEIMKTSFGEKHEQITGHIEATIKAFASDDDKKAFDSLSNNDRAAVDRLVYKMQQAAEARVQKVMKEHGIKETGSQSEGGNFGSPAQDKAAMRSQIRAEMRELDSKPHTAAQKTALQNKLNELLK